jgi:hypothetical protein
MAPPLLERYDVILCHTPVGSQVKSVLLSSTAKQEEKTK